MQIIYGKRQNIFNIFGLMMYSILSPFVTLHNAYNCHPVPFVGSVCLKINLYSYSI